MLKILIFDFRIPILDPGLCGHGSAQRFPSTASIVPKLVCQIGARICSRKQSEEAFIHSVDGSTDPRLLQLGSGACSEAPSPQPSVPVVGDPFVQV